MPASRRCLESPVLIAQEPPELMMFLRPRLQSILFLLAVFALAPGPAFAQLCQLTSPPLLGDVDASGAVDQADVDVVLADLNQPVGSSSCGATCDLDGDGTITILDSRIVVEECTLPGCALVDCSFVCATGAELRAPGATNQDEFGKAVDFDGNRIVIGAPSTLLPGDSEFDPSGAALPNSS